MNKEECLQLLKKFEGSTFINYCGVKLEDADCGWVKASMPVKKEITNPFGFIHGVNLIYEQRKSGAYGICRSRRGS